MDVLSSLWNSQFPPQHTKAVLCSETSVWGTDHVLSQDPLSPLLLAWFTKPLGMSGIPGLLGMGGP